MKIFLILFLIAIYIGLLINRLMYLKKNYKDDLSKLVQNNYLNERTAMTQMIRSGTARYSPNTSDGVVKAIKNEGEKEVERLSRKYEYDKWNSILTCLTSIFTNK